MKKNLLVYLHLLGELVFVFNQELAAGEKWVVLAVTSPFCQAPSNPTAIMLPFQEEKKVTLLPPGHKKV